jgi:hypothetical protein
MKHTHTPRLIVTVAMLALGVGALNAQPVLAADITRPTTTRPAWHPGGVAGRVVDKQISQQADGSALVPVLTDWTSRDNTGGSGVCSQQMQLNGGLNWFDTTINVTGANGYAGSFMYWVPDVGDPWTARARAVDCAGNTGLWATSPTVHFVTAQETAAVYTGSWYQSCSSDSWKGCRLDSQAVGDSARFTFTGRNFVWVSTTRPGGGSAKVYVNGTYIKTVSTYAGAFAPRMMVFFRHWSSVGTHTFKIVSLGPWVSVDGFVVLQ